MARQKLNLKILSKFKKKFPSKTENAIQVKLSKLSRKYNVPLNASAEIWAKEEGFSVWGLLDNKEKESLGNKTFQVINVKKKVNNNPKKNIISFISYETNNQFLKKHIEEINKCYTFHCYTAVFILTRKIIENIIMEIIKKKFPDGKDENLYLNFDTGHIRDLSELIKNLRDKSNNFAPDEKKLIQRILELSSKFKKEANDKTHSIYYISSKNELDNSDPQSILDLIKEFFKEHLK